MSTRWKDQEAWCLTIHGVEMRVLTAFFTPRYLECVDGAYMHPIQRLMMVFRTVPMHFKSKDARIEGILMCHLHTTFGRVIIQHHRLLFM